MKLDQEGKRRRSYRMGARARAAEETGRRIIWAVTALMMERWLDEFTLDDVAGRAEVTVQTVLRRFGSKEALVAAAGAQLEQHVVQQRGAAIAGDVAAAVRNLFDHYEEVAPLVLRALAQEARHPWLRTLLDRGRHVHYEWAERVFAPWLARTDEAGRSRRLAQLATMTDIYVWKLLRYDRQLEREAAEAALGEMLGALTGQADDKPS